MKTLVLGIGNTILGDDGVGVRAARQVAGEVRDVNVAVKDTAAAGLNLLDNIIGYERLIVIDALLIDNEETGKIYRFGLDEIGKAAGTAASHSCGLAAALEIGKKLYPGEVPKDVVIYAVGINEVGTVTEEMTPGVKAALPELVKRVLAGFVL